MLNLRREGMGCVEMHKIGIFSIFLRKTACTLHYSSIPKLHDSAYKRQVETDDMKGKLTVNFIAFIYGLDLYIVLG